MGLGLQWLHGVRISTFYHSLGFGGGNSRATTVSANDMRLCDPSQNGLLAEWPQRQSEITVRPARPKAAPAGSTISNSPSMRIGPLCCGEILVDMDGWYHAGHRVLFQSSSRTSRGKASLAQSREERKEKLWVAAEFAALRFTPPSVTPSNLCGEPSWLRQSNFAFSSEAAWSRPPAFRM